MTSSAKKYEVSTESRQLIYPGAWPYFGELMKKSRNFAENMSFWVKKVAQCVYLDNKHHQEGKKVEKKGCGVPESNRGWFGINHNEQS